MKFPGTMTRRALHVNWLIEKTLSGKPPIIRRLPMGSVKSVVDVGAHFGMVSALARFLHPEADVVAVEPNKSNYSILLENARHLRIRILPCAVGADGVAYLQAGRGSSDHSYEDKNDQGLQQVDCFSLESMFRQFKLKREGLYLKIDIEGSEHHFLDQPETIEIFRSCVGIDFDLHNSPEVPKTTIYREWFEKHFAETHDIEYYDGRKRGRRATAVLVRKDIPLLKHCLGD